jgi:hypothetical protein
MSRSYSFKPELKKRSMPARSERKIILDDYEIEFIESKIGPSVSLRFQ